MIIDKLIFVVMIVNVCTNLNQSNQSILNVFTHLKQTKIINLIKIKQAYQFNFSYLQNIFIHLLTILSEYFIYKKSLFIHLFDHYYPNTSMQTDEYISSLFIKSLEKQSLYDRPSSISKTKSLNPIQNVKYTKSYTRIKQLINTQVQASANQNQQRFAYKIQYSKYTPSYNTLYRIIQNLHHLKRLLLLQQSFLIIITVLMLFSIPVNSISTSSPLPTMYYEPSSIQTGSHTFVQADDIDPTAPLFKTQFNITFDRIHLSGANNKVIVSIMNMNIFLYDLGDWSNLWVNDLPQVNIFHSTSFYLFIQARQQTIRRLRLSYLGISQSLTLQNDIIIQNWDTIWWTFPGRLCNGTSTIINCPYYFDFNSPLPSLNYKIFCSAFFFRTYRRDNTTNPHLSLYPDIINSTKYKINLTLIDVEVQNFNFVVFLIKNTLFDPTQRYEVMFTSLHVNQLTTASINYSFDIIFPHMASQYNVFYNFLGMEGKPIRNGIFQDIPASNIMRGVITNSNNFLELTALAFYGYIKHCPTYFMELICQSCPFGCAKCHVYPSFHCEVCETNFVPAGNMSCVCNLPFSIISGKCNQFAFGCINGGILLNGSTQCYFCDIGKKLILNSSYQCECINGYQFDSNGTCVEFCGDGFVFQDQCDDGNTQSNDGCNSTCSIQAGFNINMSTSPPTIKSQILLQYEINEIIKDEFTNSATLKLKNKNSFQLPFILKATQFLPLSTYLTLKIITSKYPLKQVQYKIKQISIVSDNKIYLDFDYDFTVQALSAQLNLNYEKTKYKNDTQKLQFSLKGTNKPLKFQPDMATFKTLGQGLMIGSILNVVCLLIGLLSPKYIGLQSILTLQFIYYSQLLISNVSQWPPGFVFLKYLKISGGYNDIVEYTEYFLLSDLSKKMQNLFIKKLIIENFSINFIILFMFSSLLCIFAGLRNTQQKFVTKTLKQRLQPSRKTKQKQWPEEKSQLEKLRFLNKLNEAFCWVGSQIIFWMFLPLICAVGSYLLIPNSSFQFIVQDSGLWLVKFEGIIVFVSLFFIFAIGSNNFFNFWLSLSSYNKLLERPQEITYKRTLFIYLLIQGSLIFFFNDFVFGPLYTSVLVMLIHLIYILLLIKINPYKQSLKVHTICLLFNQGVYLGFIFVINLINFIENTPSLIILILGYFVTICCAISIILTVFRLYYELRYGPALEEQIQEERRKQKEEERLRKQRLLKKKQDELEEQAKLKISQKDQLRQKNDYLFENQINEENKIELLKWLQTRKWDQKAKQIYYFKHFAQKPLKWLRQNDNQKYSQKLRLIQFQEQQKTRKQTQIKTDSEYKETIQRLKKQFKAMKKMNNTIKNIIT